MRILGVDEAGRGCVIGPLVIAGVMIDQENLYTLKSLEVKDSKLLSRDRREHLAEKIRSVAVDTYVIKLSPAQIDKAVRSQRKHHKLNRLEAQTMAELIERLEPDVAIVDAADVLSARFRCHIIELLSHPVQVISEHRADRNYPVVSAASIVAKVERDHHIDFLRNRFGDFGSGYMSDPKTKAFLEELAERCTTYPDFVRASWKPARIARANARMKQVKLA